MRLDSDEILRILPAKQAAERRLVALPGVTGVDVGFKQVGGVQTPVYAILVFVAKKGVYEPGDEIPRQIAGVPTDVIEAVFRHRAAPVASPATIDTKRYDPVQGGACIFPARFNNMYGSLGMLVEDADTGAQLWLSAYHVLCVDAGWSNPGVDTRVTQPAIMEGGRAATDTIGNIVRGTYGQVEIPWGYDLYVDAAVATTSGRKVSGSIVMVGTPKGARNATINDLVEKYGATTGLRHGVIVSTNLTVNVEGVWFYYQYRADPPFPGQPSMAEAGDSGAAVVDSDFYAIGLVMATTGVITVVNPIGQILEALNLSMS